MSQTNRQGPLEKKNPTVQKVWNGRRLPLNKTESRCASLPPSPECEHLKTQQSSDVPF